MKPVEVRKKKKKKVALHSRLCLPSCLAGPPGPAVADPLPRPPPGLEQWLEPELADRAARGWRQLRAGPPPLGVAGPARGWSTRKTFT